MAKNSLTRRTYFAGALLVASAAACGPLRREQAGPDRPVGQASLVFTYWPAGGQAGIALVEDEVLPLFRAKQPHVHVQSVVHSTGHYPKLVTMFAAGTPPDVTAIDNYHISEFSAQGVLHELESFIKRDRFRLDQYFDAALIEGVWKGKRYGMSYIGASRVLFYHQELFAKAGLKTPHELFREGKWTQETFLDAARRLTLKGPDGQIAQFGYNFARGLPFTTESVWDFGGELLDTDHRRCLLDTPAAVAGYQYLQDLIYRHRVAPTPQEQQGVNLRDEGRVAMEEIWRGAVVGMRRLPFAWDVAPRPRGKAGHLTLYKGNSMSMARDTKAPEAAWLLLTFLTGPEADRAYVKGGGATPLRANVDVFVGNTPPANSHYWIDAYKYAKMLPLNPAWSQIDRAYNEEMGELWLNRRAPRDAIRSLVPKINDILAAMREGLAPTLDTGVKSVQATVQELCPRVDALL